MTIDPATGRIEWTPTLVGVTPVTVNVSNGVTPDAVQVFDLMVEQPQPISVLSSGEAQTGAVAEGEWLYYPRDTSGDDTGLVVELTNLSTDVDLYVLNGEKPNLLVYDCRPYEGQASPETCTLPNTGATTWYIGVYGFTAGRFTINAAALSSEPYQQYSGVDGLISLEAENYHLNTSHGGHDWNVAYPAGYLGKWCPGSRFE
jgi:hypothetical protein